MKKVNKFLFVLMALPFVFMSCNSNDVVGQLRKEIKQIKSQCPIYQAEGLKLIDANLYEYEKVLEYVYSIDDTDDIDTDDIDVELLKEILVDSFKSDDSELSAFQKYSIKTILKKYDYRFRYIYNDIYGNRLYKLEITKYDLM